MRNYKNITLILLAGAFLVSLYFNFSKNKQENITIVSTEKQRFLFEMKQECRVIGENKKKEHESNGLSFMETNYTFNEELNTCLFYAYSLDIDYINDGIVREKFITDLFTDQDIVYFFQNALGEQNTQIFCDQGNVCVSEEDFNNRKIELFNE